MTDARRAVEAVWRIKSPKVTGEADSTHVLMNNCHRDYAQKNAAELAELLSG